MTSMPIHYDPNIHHRRSIRLKGYDYSQAGAYFVTICTQDRVCLLAHVVDGAVRLTPAGCMVEQVWDEVPQYYPGIETDAFVVMPNHIHGILVWPQAHRELSLPDVVHRLKSLTTALYRHAVVQKNWTPFPDRL